MGSNATPTQVFAADTCPRVWVGVDVGGTTINVVLLDDSGNFVGAPRGESDKGHTWTVHRAEPVLSMPVGDDHLPSSVVQRVRQMAEGALLRAKMDMSQVLGVGVCTPGLMDVADGVVHSSPNLKGWRQVPMCDLIAEAFGIPRANVFLEHDTNAALLAEVAKGAAIGLNNVVLMSLGTGVGGAIMCDGKLLRGSRGQAGEVGHSIVNPDGRTWGTTGVRGILEGYASASAVAARANENGGPPEGSSLRKVDGPIQCADVFKHAETGDEYARKIVSETASFIAIGAINCARFVDPDVILLAGGMVQAGEFLLEQVRQEYAGHHWNLEPVRVAILAACAGVHSGAIGAALAAKYGHESRRP